MSWICQNKRCPHSPCELSDREAWREPARCPFNTGEDDFQPEWEEDRIQEDPGIDDDNTKEGG